MKLRRDEGKEINWHNSKMLFKTTLSQTNNVYSTILVTNPPGVGPALHLHPNGPESFYILEGEYTFVLPEILSWHRRVTSFLCRKMNHTSISRAQMADECW